MSITSPGGAATLVPRRPGWFGQPKKEPGREPSWWGIPHWSTDYKAVVERENVNIVDILLPHDLHREATCLAAAHGKHVVLEKLIAPTLQEAWRSERRMVQINELGGGGEEQVSDGMGGWGYSASEAGGDLSWARGPGTDSRGGLTSIPLGQGGAP